MSELNKARVERDAALAAVERVRAIHGPSDEFPAGCDYCERLTPCSTRAALDGAPEPEVREMPETGNELRDEDGDLISSGKHLRILQQGMYVCDTCTNVLGLNVRWDRAGFMEGHPLPVEGGSKP